MGNYEPKIRDNYVALQDDFSIVIDVFAEVRQRDGDVLTVSAVSNPVNGIVAIEADRTVAYAPDRQFHGVRTFTYTIDDEHGLTSAAAVNAPVTPVNDRPVVECGPETDADATGRTGRFDCAVSDVTATRRCSASHGTHLLAELVMNAAPTTNVAAAAGTEDAGFIANTLTGSDIDGTVRSFSLSSLPANGSLYIDAGLTTLVATGVDYPAAAESLTLYFVPNADLNCSASFDYATTDDATSSEVFYA